MRFLICTSLFLLSVGCDKPPRKVEAFAEAFSVSVDGSGVVPAFEMAMMMTKGASPAPFVQPSTTLLVQALKKCAASDDKNEHKLAAEIVVNAGTPTVRSATSENPFEACLGEAVKSGSVEWPKQDAPVTMRIELRLAKRSAT